MIIKIAGLRDGIHYYKFEEPVENLNLDKQFVGNLKAEVELSKSHSEIILNVDVKVNINCDCDRCTTEFMQEINPVYQMVYLFTNEAEETDDSNVIYLNPDADKINIAPEIRDYVLLTVPMKRLCTEECKGLCSRCGRNLNEEDNCNCEGENIDSRWLPLQDLKKKLENK
jgi:uncharacterized protein